MMVFVLLLLIIALVPYTVRPSSSRKPPPGTFGKENGDFFKVPKGYIYYETHGTPSHKAVVLIHGFGASMFCWRHVAASLVAQGHFVVTVDILGFGLSSKLLRTNYDHKSQASYIHTLLSYIGVKNADFVGHSLGANIVLWLTQLYPSFSGHVVLVSSAIYTCRNVRMRLANIALHIPWTVQVCRILLNVIYLVIKHNKRIPFPHLRFKNSSLYTDEFIQGYALPYETKDWDLGIIATVRDFVQNVLPNSVKTVGNKTLIIWGENDKIVPIEKGREVQKALPAAQLITISGTQHLPMEQKPTEFNNLIATFFAKT